MLWHKAWLDTRWRFLIGLALLLASAAAIVFTYDDVRALLSVADGVDKGTALGNQISEQVGLLREYRGYVWSQWIRDSLRQLWALFAVVIGAGGLLSQSARGGATFTLSLPVTRAQVLWSRAGVGLAELAVLAIAPPLVLTLLSPLAGQSYSATDALIHGVCLFVAGSTLFSATTLLSTIFNDVWRPPLIVLCIAVVMQFVRQLLTLPPGASLLGVMTGETYFLTRDIPVIGLLITAALSAVMLNAATLTIARRDF